MNFLILDNYFKKFHYGRNIFIHFDDERDNMKHMPGVCFKTLSLTKRAILTERKHSQIQKIPPNTQTDCK